MNYKIHFYPILKISFCIIFATLVLTNCERDITVDLEAPEEKIVVEGSIETGKAPIVILNTNYAYFGTFNLNAFQNNFIRNAKVTVSDGEREVMLDEICWSELSDIERQLLLGAAGNDLPEKLPENFEYCLYTIYDFDNTFIGEAGKTYSLKIRTTDERVLNATTSIPKAINLDSIWVEQHKDTTYNDFWRLYVTLNDPQTLGNYYRYYTRVGENSFLPGRSSVFDDLAINGKIFHFPLDKAILRTDEIDIDTYGFFSKGETVEVKWTTIDQATYDFWRTIEFSANSAGPLGGGTKIQSNIIGGTGIWAGYGVDQTIGIKVPE